MLMAHTVREKTKLLARVRRIRGQIDEVERAVETEIGRADVLQLIASVRGAVKGLMSEVLENHIRLHVADAALDHDRRREGADELIDVVRMYLK
jgi:FrmR/RcnR family transcriptional regulator, repressor of rcnA expression